MKQIPVRKNKIAIGKRVYSGITLLVLFLACGCGSLVAADDYVRIQADPLSGDPPLTVIFSADIQSSLGEPTRYVWSLGDGERQTEPSFSHTYAEEGNYRVNLMVQYADGTFGYADSVRITVGNPPATPVPASTPRSTPTSTATPTPTATVTPTATPAPTAAPTPIATSVSTTPEPEASPTEAPIRATVTASPTPVLVTNNNSVHPVTVSISAAEGTKPLTVEFAIEEAGTNRIQPVSSSWNFGDNVREEGNEQSHMYAESGVYSPVVTIIFSDGHTEILPLAQITVLDAVAVTAVSTETATEEPTRTPIPTETSTPTPTPTITKTVTPTATPTQAPTATPAPVLLPEVKKVDGYSVVIVPDKVSGRTPLHVRFTSETQGGLPLAWKWNFGDGDKNNVEKPAHNYGTPGTYVVQLSVQFRGPVWVEAEPIVITVG